MQHEQGLKAPGFIRFDLGYVLGWLLWTKTKQWIPIRQVCLSYGRFLDVKIVKIGPYLNVYKNGFFDKTRIQCVKKFDLAFLDMCNPRHMCSVFINDRKIFCAIFGLVQLKFRRMRLFVEFLICAIWCALLPSHSYFPMLIIANFVRVITAYVRLKYNNFILTGVTASSIYFFILTGFQGRALCHIASAKCTS